MDFLKQIQLHLLEKLPGKTAQFKMAPAHRSSDLIIPKDAKQSAVIILLFHKKNVWHFILIERSEDGKTHSGQISFPGGRVDQNDFSKTFTALRECEEEIGISKNNIQILGNLSSLYIPPSNFLVQPIIAYTEKEINFIRSENEVQEIIEVSIEDFFDRKNKIEGTVFENKLVPAYQLTKNKIVWGATAMILAEFEEIYFNVISKK
ncbi:MAG: CoA pyrophosphatase [Chitinophagaceae bacterium]|nr:CoA pyrophosphatase [Chitinophagaceae bacterium]